MAITVPPIKRKRITLRIEGESPLQMHKWSEKAITMMREKQAGKKTKTRDARNPEAECEAATYRMPDGTPAIPGMAVKRAIITAAHKDIGIEKTLVRKAIFLEIDDPNGYIPLSGYSEPWMREDQMRVGMGTTDLRYRPQFEQWGAVITFEVDGELLTDDDLIRLIDRAGFGVGILEGRPEKGRDFGRFRVDTEFEVTVVTL